MVSGDVLILKSKVNFKSLNEISYGKRRKCVAHSGLAPNLNFFVKKNGGYGMD
jgi:hypothetical protein